MWIDSHAHLSDVDDQRLDGLIDDAQAHGVGRILNSATSLSSSASVIRQCRLHPCLSAAVGISPFDAAGDLRPQDLYTQLSAFAEKPEVVAIGETGMDSTNPTYPPLALQRNFFEMHLCLAKSVDLPVIVHSRGCEQQVLDMCLAADVRTVVFHCYTGPRDTLKRIVDAGYVVSFSGMITFKNSPFSPLVAYTPFSNMLIETDSPYLAPVPHRGKQNSPAWVMYVGKAVSAIKNLDEEECSLKLSETFSRVFGKNHK
jgi:TatD DNase family protein